MKKITLTCAHAIVKYLISQKIIINGKKEPLFPGVFGIFGHGNVACLGQALQENQKDLLDVPDEIKKGLEIIIIKNVKDALRLALVTHPQDIKDQQKGVNDISWTRDSGSQATA